MSIDYSSLTGKESRAGIHLSQYLPTIYSKYTDISPIMPIHPYRSKIANALCMVSEVTPSNGGRLLRLSSVFSVKNNTSNSIQLLCQVSPRERKSSSSRELSEGSDNQYSSRNSPSTIPSHPSSHPSSQPSQQHSQCTPTASPNHTPAHSHSHSRGSPTLYGEDVVGEGFEPADMVPTELREGEKFRVPLALLHRSISESKGQCFCKRD